MFGGYTILSFDEKGLGRIDFSKAYGQYFPTIGKEKTGHVERQFYKEIEPILDRDISGLKGLNRKIAAIVIEINQWYTPCSGESGCALFINNDIVGDLQKKYKGVDVFVRAQAQEIYESGLSEPHPSRMKSDHSNLQTKQLQGLEGMPSLVGQSAVIHKLLNQKK
ncbi:MAG: hypothetical protein HC935_10875 [Pseudanabaena sp. SU_2_4]|nr:hypothetical protein [Pseudanabaena sp. SU_2_4]